MSLLADPDPAVAEMAAKSLHSYRMPIDAKYLPQVRAGLDRKLSWLPAVLGDIQSDEAAREAVARFLVSEDAPDNQEGFAVARAGARAIPFIVEAARCDRGCGKDDIFYLGAALADMGPERAAAAPGLLAIAQDPTASEEKVAGALSLLSDLGRDAASTESALVALKQRWPSRAQQIDNALIAMHSPRAGAIFAERLGDQPDMLQLRDLAAVGPAARDAGPAVVALLSNPDPEVRLAAARAVGFIGYTPAVDPLTAMLDDPFDVRASWAAAESLGRLRDPRALPALERAAHSHWYPAVRETAARAATSLRSKSKFVGKDENLDHFPSTFFAFWNIGEDVPACETPSAVPASQLPYRKLTSEHDRNALAKLAYAAILRSDGPTPPPPPELAAQAEKMAAEHAHWLASQPDIVPSVGIRIGNGWLVGSNRGEFGGELIYVGDDGKQQQVVGENVVDLHVLGKRTVLVAGLAHLGFNGGALHEIARAPDGTMRSTIWRILPGAPRAAWLTDSGELLVRLNRAGTVLVSPDGSMRMAPCSSQRDAGSDNE
jgi:hypothetical protein